MARRYEQVACWGHDFREFDAAWGKNLRDVIHFLQGKPEFNYLLISGTAGNIKSG